MAPGSTSVPTPNVLHPLTTFDNGAEAVGVCVKYVLTGDALALGKLEGAIKSVTEKWRVLAGRTEWLAEKKIWAIRVPTGELPPNYPTYTFTTTLNRTTPYPSAIPSYTPQSASYRAQPSPSLFLHPSTPKGNKSYSSNPLISVHVTVFKDATCVGLSFGHGCFDGVGFGEVVRALNAEFGGKEWEVPPLPTGINTLASHLSSVVLPPSTPPPPISPYSYFVPSSPLVLSKFVVSMMVQHFYHGIERGEVYLGKEVVERIVGEVKKELRARGKGEWVSTADVVNAWVLKAANLDEPDSPNTLECFHAFNVRPVLADTASSRSLDTYPHNAVLIAELPSLPLSSLSTLPLSTLSLHFRQALTTHRTLPHIKHQSSLTSTATLLPHRAWGVDEWGFSNQVMAGFDRIDWGEGVRTSEMVVSPFPFNLDNNVYLNRLDGGYVVTGDVRKSRWRAIENPSPGFGRYFWTDSTHHTRAPPSPPLPPVDSHCIPLSLLPPPTPLPKATLLKLHKLAALSPPADDDAQRWQDLESLGGLVSIMEGVRAARAKVVEETENLMHLADVTKGSYYVVRTPVGIRGKARKGAVEEEVELE